jgi:MFS family permease
MQDRSNVVAQLIPFSVVAFLGFLAVGLPLPTYSLYITSALHFNAAIVGGVIGLQSLATLFTRQYAGRLSDSRGLKQTALIGLCCGSVSGWLSLMSTIFIAHPAISLTVLCGARVLLGIGESLFITALAAWSIARVGAHHAGQAMAWSGIAMYAALAIGAPLGLAIYHFGGFRAVTLASALTPILGVSIAYRLQNNRAVAKPEHTTFFWVLRQIWAPGLGLALASSGIATVNAFLSLRYSSESWPNVGLALATFGAAYIAVRLVFGSLPDKLGGYRTGLLSLTIQASGLLTVGWCVSDRTGILTRFSVVRRGGIAADRGGKPRYGDRCLSRLF